MRGDQDEIQRLIIEIEDGWKEVRWPSPDGRKIKKDLARIHVPETIPLVKLMKVASSHP